VSRVAGRLGCSTTSGQYFKHSDTNLDEHAKQKEIGWEHENDACLVVPAQVDNGEQH
jgi:hypothetical protein